MRLWHYALIPYLPKSQLLAQWRELNSIFKNQPKHILINYIYEYPKTDLFSYSNKIINELIINRGYKIKSMNNFNNYFAKEISQDYMVNTPFRNHHNFRYLQQCFYNLQEKFDRGQTDFSQQQYEALNELMKKEIPF